MITGSSGIRTSEHKYFGWLGVECRDVASAVWLMRAMLARNILSRREGNVYFVPVDPVRDPDGEISSAAVLLLHRLAELSGAADTHLL